MKEKISKLMSCIWKMIQDLFYIIKAFFNGIFPSSADNDDKAINTYKLNMAINTMMHQMTIDLYRAFHAHSYSLCPIKTVESIRLYNWKKQNGFYFYQFAIDKRTPDRIATFQLRQMEKDMNTDICSARHNILYFDGAEYLYYTFPFLYHGIKVTSVQDSGSTYVIVTVCSALTPQEFIMTYRQNML